MHLLGMCCTTLVHWGDGFLGCKQLGPIRYRHHSEVTANRFQNTKTKQVNNRTATVSSLPLGFNLLPSCLKAITVASCQNWHGTRCVRALCSSHCPHHSISNGARLPLWRLPIISSNIWRCGASSKRKWRSVLLLHISERTLHKLKTICTRRSASEQPAMFVMP